MAVALFAALSYVVTQTGRGSTSVDREEAGLAVAELTSHGNQIMQAIQRMTIIYGIPLEEIDWHTADRLRVDESGPVIRTNSLCASDSCRLFNPNGGDATYLDFRHLGVENMATRPDVAGPGRVKMIPGFTVSKT